MPYLFLRRSLLVYSLPFLRCVICKCKREQDVVNRDIQEKASTAFAFPYSFLFFTFPFGMAFHISPFRGGLIAQLPVRTDEAHDKHGRCQVVPGVVQILLTRCLSILQRL